MKKCPKCFNQYGKARALPDDFKFCPYCGGNLYNPHPRRVKLTRIEWEEVNKWEYEVPWEVEIKVKGLADESF